MTDAQNEIEYSTKIVIDGHDFFQSLAHQLANHVCKKVYEEFRLSAELGFTAATIYIEYLRVPATEYTAARYSEKKCIGVILFDVDNNRMTLRKTNVDRKVHEFHADGNLDDCFGVQYEIFKYLRDGDVIQIHTVERELRRKAPFVYRITKIKALKNGRFLHFKGHGTQFFIPIADFKREEGKSEKKRGKPSKGRC